MQMKRIGGGTAQRGGVTVNGARGRFAVTSGLTEKQRAFVLAYVANGGIATQAAETAGYAVPHTEGWRLMNIPQIRDAIHAEQSRVIECDLATLGVKVIKDLMTNEDTPAHVRFQAARFALESAGHGAASAPVAPGADRPFIEMDIVELTEFATRGREAIKALAFVDVDAVASPVMPS